MKQRFKITKLNSETAQILERDFLKVKDTTCDDEFICLRVKYSTGRIEFIPKSYDGESISADDRYGAMLEACFQNSKKTK